MKSDLITVDELTKVLLLGRFDILTGCDISSTNFYVGLFFGLRLMNLLTQVVL